MPGLPVLVLLILVAMLVGAAPSGKDAEALAEPPSNRRRARRPPSLERASGRPRRAALYVATDGSNAGRCAKARPCRSFNRAWHVARPSDTVEVAGGRYPSQTLFGRPAPPHARDHPTGAWCPGRRRRPRRHGRVHQFEGARYVTIRGFKTPYTRVGGLRHQCGVTIGRSNAHHVTLRNIDAGMIWFGADHVEVYGGDFGPGIDENTKISTRPATRRTTSSSTARSSTTA